MTGFLDLSRELRQKTLLVALTDNDLIEKDLEFNRIFLNVFKNETLHTTLQKYLSNEPLPPTAKDEDLRWVDDNKIWELGEDIEIPIFTPIHTITLAKDLTSIDPQIAEDMEWVMKKRFGNLVHVLEVEFKPSLSYRSKHKLPYKTLLPMISHRGFLPTTNHPGIQHFMKQDWNRASNLVWKLSILKFLCKWSKESCGEIKKRWATIWDEHNDLGKNICEVKGDTEKGRGIEDGQKSLHNMQQRGI